MHKSHAYLIAYFGNRLILKAELSWLVIFYKKRGKIFHKPLQQPIFPLKRRSVLFDVMPLCFNLALLVCQSFEVSLLTCLENVFLTVPVR